jgi:hypothetical protein
MDSVWKAGLLSRQGVANWACVADGGSELSEFGEAQSGMKKSGGGAE